MRKSIHYCKETTSAVKSVVFLTHCLTQYDEFFVRLSFSFFEIFSGTYSCEMLYYIFWKDWDSTMMLKALVLLKMLYWVWLKFYFSSSSTSFVSLYHFFFFFTHQFILCYFIKYKNFFCRFECVGQILGGFSVYLFVVLWCWPVCAPLPCGWRTSSFDGGPHEDYWRTASLSLGRKKNRYSVCETSSFPTVTFFFFLGLIFVFISS